MTRRTRGIQTRPTSRWAVCAALGPLVLLIGCPSCSPTEEQPEPQTRAEVRECISELSKSALFAPERFETLHTLHDGTDFLRFATEDNPIAQMETVYGVPGHGRALKTLLTLRERAVGGLLEGLQDPEPRIRVCSAWVLGRAVVGIEKTVPALLHAFDDEDASVRHEAGRAMRLIAFQTSGPALDRAVPKLIRALKHKHADVRYKAADTLGNIRFAALGPLLQALKHPDPEVRRFAALGLEVMATPSDNVIAGLEAALRDEDEDVRTEAAEAIGKIGPLARTASPSLVRALADKGECVRGEAARALVQVHPEAAAQHAVPVLLELAKWRRIWMRSPLSVLAKLGPRARGAVPQLIPLLNDEFRGFRAAWALLEIAPDVAAKKAIPAFARSLTHRSWFVSSESAQALGRIGPLVKQDGSAIAALVKALKDERDIVWQNAALALGRIDPEIAARQALPVCLQKASSTSTGARRYAMQALGKISAGAPRAIAALRQALKDKKEWVRVDAAKALGNIGPPAKGVLQALVEALGDPFPCVRYAAAGALGRVDPPTGVTHGLPVVMTGLKDDVRWREFAGEALVKIDPSAAPKALAVFLPDLQAKSWGKRLDAARALGLLGPPAKDAIPALTEALKDEHPLVRQVAAKALKRIDGGVSATRSRIP